MFIYKDTKDFTRDQLLHLIREMRERGLNINQQDSKGWTALHYACLLGNETAVRCLLDTKKVDISLLTYEYVCILIVICIIMPFLFLFLFLFLILFVIYNVFVL